MGIEPTNKGFADHPSNHCKLKLINELTLNSVLAGPGLGPTLRLVWHCSVSRCIADQTISKSAQESTEWVWSPPHEMPRGCLLLTSRTEGPLRTPPQRLNGRSRVRSSRTLRSFSKEISSPRMVPCRWSTSQCVRWRCTSSGISRSSLWASSQTSRRTRPSVSVDH